MLSFKDNKDGYYQFADDAPSAWYEHLTPCQPQISNIVELTYKQKRAKLYAPIPDQLDMIYHDHVNGTTTWKDHITQVKSAIPKT